MLFDPHDAVSTEPGLVDGAARSLVVVKMPESSRRGRA
jgi:hypothetical protein